MPRNVKPMLATLVREPFDDPDWLFEIKWDGYRAIASWDGERAWLESRTGQDFSGKYPQVYDALRQLKHRVVLDGEIVALDESGRAHFGWLQRYGQEPQGRLVYQIFDLIWLDGYDTTDLPLHDRKELLQTLLPHSPILQFSDHVDTDGRRFFAAAEKQHLEGIMAKRADSGYAAGRRSEHWLKIKTALRQEVVIGGFTEPKGSRQSIGALIVGVYRRGKLHYAGHVGGGFPPEGLAALRKQLEQYQASTSPFEEQVKPNAPVHWLRPELMCEVTFSEWTGDKRMRQPIFVGLRSDKDPAEVTIEKPKAVQRHRTFSKEAPMTGDGKHFTFTHAEKVFWPESGITKGDLLHYYKQVAPVMLPYLKDRPLSLLRHPNGYKGPSFFQKDITNPPPGITTQAIFSESTNEDVHYLICEGWESLAYAVQLGSIEINPWNSTLAHRTKPDWAVIDLDPEGVSFDDVIKVAQATHRVCQRYGIDAYPKTSGKTGIHIFIPLHAAYEYEQALQFGHLLAALIHEEIPAITSLERNPAKRKHKIYLDFLQNRMGQTLAAPYSVRPTKAASVSAPLLWSEVRKGLRPEKFTLQTMPQRLEKVGDLWKPVRGKGVDLEKILQRMEADKKG